MNTSKSIQLSNRFSIDESLYIEYLNAFQSGIFKLEPNIPYTAEAIMGVDKWYQLESNYQKQLAGASLAHMVNLDLLPLKVHPIKKGVTMQYTLKL